MLTPFLKYALQHDGLIAIHLSRHLKASVGTVIDWSESHCPELEERSEVILDLTLQHLRFPQLVGIIRPLAVLRAVLRTFSEVTGVPPCSEGCDGRCAGCQSAERRFDQWCAHEDLPDPEAQRSLFGMIRERILASDNFAGKILRAFKSMPDWLLRDKFAIAPGSILGYAFYGREPLPMVREGIAEYLDQLADEGLQGFEFYFKEMAGLIPGLVQRIDRDFEFHHPSTSQSWLRNACGGIQSPTDETQRRVRRYIALTYFGS